MPETPPTAEELARWLLANEVGERRSHEELTMAALRTYEHLRDHFAVFLGNQGFDALWTRALHLARRTFPWESRDPTIDTSTPQHILQTATDGRDADEAQKVLLTIFRHFFTVLFSFIGADLGLRLLRQQWPALMVSEHVEETPQ